MIKNKTKIKGNAEQAELGQAQHNWKFGFAEAKVEAELGNKSSSYCSYKVYLSSWLTLLYYV